MVLMVVLARPQASPTPRRLREWPQKDVLMLGPPSVWQVAAALVASKISEPTVQSSEDSFFLHWTARKHGMYMHLITVCHLQQAAKT